jgi:hypothetical protein
VYAEAIVRATLRAIEPRTTITLPTDIEPLVEEVYPTGLPSPDDPLEASFIAFKGETIGQRQDAQQRVLPRPTQEDDPFGDLRVVFDDDEDPTLHQQLRAITRSGPPSVEIVCLVQQGPSLFADEACTIPVDLSAEPDRALTRALVRRSVGVSRPSLVSKLLADASYQPAAWAKSPLLEYRRVVCFDPRVAVVGSTRLELHPELGLMLSNL